MAEEASTVVRWSHQTPFHPKHSGRHGWSLFFQAMAGNSFHQTLVVLLVHAFVGFSFPLLIFGFSFFNNQEYPLSSIEFCCLLNYDSSVYGWWCWDSWFSLLLLEFGHVAFRHGLLKRATICYIEWCKDFSVCFITWIGSLMEKKEGQQKGGTSGIYQDLFKLVEIKE